MPFDPDHPFLHPEQNRDETIFIEMDGFLINRCAGIVINMLHDVMKWKKLYPNIELFFDMNASMIYHVTENFSLPFFMKTLYHIDGEKRFYTKKMVDSHIKELEKEDYINYVYMTTIGFAFNRVASQSCTKKVIIYKETDFYPWQLQYLNVIFSDSSNKIDVVSGDLLDVMRSVEDEVTTFCINNPKILEHFSEQTMLNEDEINQKLFLLRANNQVIRMGEDISSTEYLQTDLLNRLKEKNKINTGVIFNAPIDRDLPPFPICGG